MSNSWKKPGGGRVLEPQPRPDESSIEALIIRIGFGGGGGYDSIVSKGPKGNTIGKSSDPN